MYFGANLKRRTSSASSWLLLCIWNVTKEFCPKKPFQGSYFDIVFFDNKHKCTLWNSMLLLSVAGLYMIRVKGEQEKLIWNCCFFDVLMFELYGFFHLLEFNDIFLLRYLLRKICLYFEFYKDLLPLKE